MTEAQGPSPVVWDTKIAVVLRDDLKDWQKLNVTAFTTSGIAATVGGVTGEPYEDASGVRYLPMFVQPVLVFVADHETVAKVHERALRREVTCSVYTEDLFVTNNDVDNRAAVRRVETDKLAIVGLAFRADRKSVDKIVKGASLHP
ncbi:DUF2000 family protein [Actinokineospora auranticolor]|uniref:DUF2000 family protein n=1 Tax=Actinokineospora auranticolor TaxID=155976 RepID=A0A2S6GHY1_9PSEU|nr:DUF2000 family protein [Actinokineospora auranticolor]PPK64834.1 hypothetical protein CLV40_11773 [Actinokineospora auranticolor]